MAKIFKYTLAAGKNEFQFPKFSEVLTVQVQHGQPQIWVLHPSMNQPMEKVNFEVVPTGQECEVTFRNYVGTFQLENGLLVFHVFKE